MRPGVGERLIDRWVAPYLVSASLIAALSQRLVRKICPNCKDEYEPAHNIRKIVEKWTGSTPTFYRGIGCKKCRNTGYSGRIAIHELFVPDDKILDLITQSVPLKMLRAAAVENGMIPLHLDGIQKVAAGITTIDEILRTSSVPEELS
jgi:type IV pilus assembly protein PilB